MVQSSTPKAETEALLTEIRILSLEVRRLRTAVATEKQMPSEKLSYSVREAAEATGIGRTVLYEEQAAGRLQFRKRGSATLVMRDELERYLLSLPIS